MTLERARQLLQTQVSFRGGYNRQGARLILAEVAAREHGQDEIDGLIRELGLEQVFSFKPGTSFEAPAS